MVARSLAVRDGDDAGGRTFHPSNLPPYRLEGHLPGPPAHGDHRRGLALSHAPGNRSSRDRGRAGRERAQRMADHARRPVAAPRPAAGREHHHPAAREEPLSVGVAQSAPQAQGGGDGCVARARAAQGPHPRAVSQRGGVGAGDLGGGRCKPGLLRRPRRGPRRAAGGGPRRHATASPRVQSHVPGRPDGGAPQPHPGALPRGGRLHPARSRGNRFASGAGGGGAAARVAQDRDPGANGHPA